MSVLGLVLAGPMQAWGSASRFTTRATDDAPTKSGIIGLLAAAKGLRRSDPLEDLVNLRLGVRIDQPGQLLRDFQTARTLDGKDSMPLSYRYYRADARYLVGVEANRGLLEGLAEALRSPVFPLYLGRRSCPPSDPFMPVVHDVTLDRFLLDEPWQAATWWKHRRRSDEELRVEFRIDADPDDDALTPLVDGRLVIRDEPISFNPVRRDYGWRTVRHGWITLAGGRQIAPLEHDVMGVV